MAVAIKQRAITWTNVDPDLVYWWIYASHGLSELNCVQIYVILLFLFQHEQLKVIIQVLYVARCKNWEAISI